MLGKNHLKQLLPNTKGILIITPNNADLEPVKIIKTKVVIINIRQKSFLKMPLHFDIVIKEKGQIILSQAPA